MATVYNNIDKVAGDPSAVTIKIELLWDKTDSPVAKDTDTETMYQGPFQTDVDEEGHWETSLVPNDVIEPTDNVYRITEGDWIYYIFVPSGATPTYWTGNISVTKPSWVVS